MCAGGPRIPHRREMMRQPVIDRHILRHGLHLLRPRVADEGEKTLSALGGTESQPPAGGLFLIRRRDRSSQRSGRQSSHLDPALIREGRVSLHLKAASLILALGDVRHLGCHGITLQDKGNRIRCNGLDRLPAGKGPEGMSSNAVTENPRPQLAVIESPVRDRPWRRHDGGIKSSGAIENASLICGEPAGPDRRFIDAEIRILAAYLHCCPSRRDGPQLPGHDLRLHPVIKPDRGLAFNVLDEKVVPAQVLGQVHGRGRVPQVGHNLVPGNPYFTETIETHQGRVRQRLHPSRSTRLRRRLQRGVRTSEPECDGDILDFRKRLGGGTHGLAAILLHQAAGQPDPPDHPGASTGGIKIPFSAREITHQELGGFLVEGGVEDEAAGERRERGHVGGRRWNGRPTFRQDGLRRGFRFHRVRLGGGLRTGIRPGGGRIVDRGNLTTTGRVIRFNLGLGLGGLPRVTCQFRSGIRLLFDRTGNRWIRRGSGDRRERRHGGGIQPLVFAGGQRSPILLYFVEHEDANGSPHHDDRDQGQPGHHTTTTPDRFRRRGHRCRNNGSCYRSDGDNHVSPEGNCRNSNRRPSQGQVLINPLQAPRPENQARSQKIGPAGMGVEGHTPKEHLLGPVVIDQVGGGDISGARRFPHRAHLDQVPAILGEHPVLGGHLLNPAIRAKSEHARLNCMTKESDSMFSCREVRPRCLLVQHSAIPVRLHTLTMDKKDSSGFQGQRTSGEIG